jgi:hypothetical protein
MAQRALDADRLQRGIALEEAGESDHGVRLEKRERAGGTVEVEPAGVQRTVRAVQRIGIDLQPQGERGTRRDAGAHPAEGAAFDRPVQPERVAPEGFVAEGVEAERGAALIEKRFPVRRHLRVEALSG